MGKAERGPFREAGCLLCEVATLARECDTEEPLQRQWCPWQGWQPGSNKVHS